MLHLPLIHRELLVAAHRRSGTWIRIATTGGAILLGCLWLVAAWVSGGTTVDGRGLWGLLSGLLWFGAAVSGPVITADAIGVERREGTLGLLFLTRIGPWEIVSGKLAAAAIRTLPLLLGVAPVLAITLLMGGVTYGEFWRLLLSLSLTGLGSLALGLMISAQTRSSGSALMTTLGVVFVWHVAPLASSELATSVSWEPVATVLRYATFSPFIALSQGSDAAYRLSPDHYWRSITGMAALIPIAITLAAWGARRDLTTASAGSGSNASLLTGPSRRRVFPENHNPLGQLLRMGLPTRILLWLPAVLLGAIVWVTGSRPEPDLGLPLFAGMLINPLPLLILAWHRTQALVEMRRSGFLDLVLTTPLDGPGGRGMAGGVLAGVGQACNGPVIPALVALFLPTLVQWTLHLGSRPFLDYLGMAGLVPLQALGVLLRYFVVNALATWFGLTAPTPTRAFLLTAGLGLFAPFLLPCLLDWVGLIALYAWARYRLNNPIRQILAQNPVRA